MFDQDLPVRFLQGVNDVAGSDKIKFAAVGHKYWAYSPFYEDWVSSSTGLGGLPLTSATTLLNKYFHFDAKSFAVNIWNNEANRMRMKTDTTYRYFGCNSIDDIMAKWGQGALDGTLMHERFEDLANLVEYDKAQMRTGANVPPNKTMTYLYDAAKMEGYTEKTFFFQFVRDWGLDDPDGRYCFYRTELMLWHSTLHLSGMIDALLYDRVDDSFVIVDWKRCKGGVKGDPKNPRKAVADLTWKARGMGLPAFEALRNNSMNRYGCQLTLYKHMFQHMTGKRISGLVLVAVDSSLIEKSPENALKIHRVPHDKYDECIRQAFQERALEMLSQCEHSLLDEHIDELIAFLPPSK